MATSNALNVPDTASSVVSSTTTGNDSEDDEHKTAMGYQQTLMYGSYSKALGNVVNTLFEKSNLCPKIQFWQNSNIFTSFSLK